MDDNFETFIMGALLGMLIAGVVPDAAINATEIRAAETICSNNEGVHKLRGSGMFSATYIECNNGVEAKVSEEKLQRYKD